MKSIKYSYSKNFINPIVEKKIENLRTRFIDTQYTFNDEIDNEKKNQRIGTIK